MAIRRYLNVFGNSVPWYGICLSVALASMAICLYVNVRRRHSDADDETQFLMAFPLMCLFGVMTAIVLDAVFTGDWRTWQMGQVHKFGLTFTGFLIGAIALLSVYGRLTGIGVRYLLNVFLPPLAIAQAIGRVGCFLGGCCYGVPFSHGISYPCGSLPYETVGNMPLLPIQLVEAALLLGLACALLRTSFSRRMYVYVVGASIIRFSVEFFRYDNRGTVFGFSVISPQQFLSLCLILVFVALFLKEPRRVQWAQ